MPDDRDVELRRAALARCASVATLDDLIPVDALRAGFWFNGRRVSFGSFYSGIFRPAQCRAPAALTLTTTPPKLSRDAPYNDGFDEATGRFVYHYRRPRQPTLAARRAADADNRALRAAYELAVPIIHFHGIAPGQYTAVAPTFITEDDPVQRSFGSRSRCRWLTAPGRAGLESRPPCVRDPRSPRPAAPTPVPRDGATCLSRPLRGGALRESALLQAAHVIGDRDPRGAATDRQRDRPLRHRRHLRVRQKSHGHRSLGAVHISRPPARCDRRADAAAPAPGVSRAPRSCNRDGRADSSRPGADSRSASSNSGAAA